MDYDDKLELLSEKARNLTSSPGVYIMKNKESLIIYIGKAKNLKNRVSQYFQHNNAGHNEKVRKMVSQVDDFDYIIVDNEFEALVLECSLIKQNNPKYNILLKDDKGYHYIKISHEQFPRITAEKQLDNDKDSTFLGPYTSSLSVKQTVEEVNRIFMLPTCSKKFPQDFRKGRPCLNFHIKGCVGVCKGEITSEEYLELISQATSYIKKGEKSMIERLTTQMYEASDSLNFERAGSLRDRINAIKKITDSQKVVMIGSENLDAIAFANVSSSESTTIAVAIFKFRNAKLVDKEDFTLTDIYDINSARQEFLKQYYLNREDIPKKIIVDDEFEELVLLQDYLTQKQGQKITISVPQKGENKQILDMVHTNASEKLSKIISRTSREVTALEELSILLGLEKTPNYIEAYDISNLGSSDIVAGMVVFHNGRPLKKAYKKFKIKETVTQDDYASMKEVITRRFNNYFEEQKHGNQEVSAPTDGFGKLPDLILLDGGKGHVATILPIIEQLGLDIPVFGMVKDSKHRTRAIAKDGGEISFGAVTSCSGFKSAFWFVTNVQDEVHRYAINYQRKVRKKTSFEITLTRVDGIGEKKANTILKHFKTKDALHSATIEELRQVAKINEKTATELYNFIQQMK